MILERVVYQQWIADSMAELARLRTAEQQVPKLEARVAELEKQNEYNYAPLLRATVRRQADRIAELEGPRQLKRYPDEKPLPESDVSVVKLIDNFKGGHDVMYEIAYSADLREGELWVQLPKLPVDVEGSQ